MKKTIILILLLVSSIFAFYHFTQNNRNELSELGTSVQNITLEYQSERGFGNDRIDIYSYSLEGEVHFNNEYANLEEIYQKEFKSLNIKLELFYTLFHQLPYKKDSRNQVKKFYFVLYF